MKYATITKAAQKVSMVNSIFPMKMIATENRQPEQKKVNESLQLLFKSNYYS